jgi:hypothetical protein
MKSFSSILICITLLLMNSRVYGQAPPVVFAQIDPNTKLTNQSGFSTLIDKLGDHQISEILTIDIGGNQFTFDVHEGKKEDIKTFQIATTGRFNYSISSISLNKDNRRHQVYGSGVIYLDKTKNYQLEVLANTNPESLYLVVKDIATQNNTTLIQPNRGDNRIGGIALANVPYFMRNGQKPVSLLLLNNVMNEKFYIYADGVIQVYNIPNNTLGVCGQKAAPYYGSWNGIVWAWSFYRNIGNNFTEKYTISTTGQVWTIAQDGTFRQYGYVTYVDF